MSNTLDMDLGIILYWKYYIVILLENCRYGLSPQELDTFTIELAVRMADLGTLVSHGTRLSLKLSVSSDEVLLFQYLV